MAKNDFKAFAAGDNANVLSQEDYETLAVRLSGFQSGVAKSAQLNKIWRQSSIMSAALAQFIVDKTGRDVIDDGNTGTLAADLKAAVFNDTTLTGQPTAPTPDANDNSTRVATTAFVREEGDGRYARVNGDETKIFSVAPAAERQHAVQLGQIGHGRCRLYVASATQLTLSPYDGNNLIINEVPQQIPGAGVSISNAGLAAATVYYVYAYMNAGAMALELSTTGHTTTGNGIEIKSRDATRTLVGMIYTTSSSQFAMNSSQVFCVNWFNRRNLSLGYANGPYNTIATSPAELTPALRGYFLCWTNEASFVSSTGGASNSSSGSTASIILRAQIDTIPVGYAFAVPSPYSTTAGGFSCSSTVSVTEGIHYLTLLANTNGAGTATISAQMAATIRG